MIVGFKTAHYEPADWHAVDNLVKAGNLANLPVMVDFGRVSGDKNIQKLLLEKLRPGDIYTHCYSGLRGELVDGKLNPAIMAARKRGVFFDLGHGAGSFFWNIAIPLAEQGFWPDSISTDMHHGSINGGMKDMLNVLSKMLLLGIPLKELIRMTTSNPAAEIRRPQLGNLDIGAEADVALLKLEQGAVRLHRLGRSSQRRPTPHRLRTDPSCRPRRLGPERPRRRPLEIVRLRPDVALQVTGIVAQDLSCGLDACRDVSFKGEPHNPVVNGGSTNYFLTAATTIWRVLPVESPTPCGHASWRAIHRRCISRAAA